MQVKEKRDKKSKKLSQEESSLEEDFHPVHCAECDTVVAMQDLDEVYHFFNIIASEP